MNYAALLDGWLKKNDVTQTEFARLIGVEQPEVSKYTRGPEAGGGRIPSIRIAVRIHLVTDGAVPVTKAHPELDDVIDQLVAARAAA